VNITSLFRAAMVPALVLTLAGGVAAQSSAEDTELQSIAAIAAPVERLARLREFSTKHPESPLAVAVHFLSVAALLESKGTSPEIVDESRKLVAKADLNDQELFEFVVQVIFRVTEELVQRNEQLDGARALLKQFSDRLSPDPAFDQLRSILAVLDASVLSTQGKSADAVAALKIAVEKAPDSQMALIALAEEHRKLGQTDEAIDALIRAESAFEGKPSDGKLLRDLFQKRHGSLNGLDARLSASKAASIKRVAIDARRVEKPSPAWKLTDLGGAEISAASLKGQIVLLDFWATWCPPCRVELPEIQALHEAYGGKGVRVVAVNCEGIPDRVAWEKLVRTFVLEKKMTMTVVNDLDYAANQAFGIEAFPTVVIIDRAGTIRFVNQGYSSAVATILRAQIDSLLAEPIAPAK
jgi:thiol-disulfide isomerase/thioredoxin